MKILIIEDDPSIAELEKTYLDFYGYECEIAANGDVGIELALHRDYALIIVDVMLPGSLDGLGVCSRIRKVKDVPLIIVSAKADDADKIAGLGLGIDDYITKPFNAGELVARVKAHIGRYDALTQKEPAVKKNVLRIRDLSIERDSHKVYVQDCEVKFTDKEYQLLLFLAENPDIVFSKEHLFDRIWGIDAYGDVSTVTVHIKKVRDKIETDPELFPYIETVWGVGYRFKG